MSLGPLPGGRPVEARLWRELNQALIARAISELSFEEGLKPEPLDQQHELWTLRLGETVSYRFKAKRRIWGNLAIEPRSLSRHDGALAAPADDVAGFMIDARAVLEIEPDTLAIYIRELSSTLSSDARVAAINAAIGEDELIALPDHRLQHYLEGHPKAPAAKGRIGWGLGDAEAYAPEFQAELQLFWVAAARDACQLSHDPSISEEDLLAASLDSAERRRLEEACLEACRRLGLDRPRFLLLPVHPWQWDNMVALQFAGEIAAGRLLPLGSFGSGYLPQQSLRTLANASVPSALHLKLSLSILNTSAWRGVPGKYMAIGPVFSAWLAEKAATDPALAPATVLREPAGAFYPHPLYERIEGVPYQFREMLGAIWRESVETRLEPGQNAIMLGALTKLTPAGRPIVSALIVRSGLSHEAWLERFFDAVAVPLYHFLCRYGVGFIAHGQNVTLVLERFTPCGVALKDLQGDADLVDQDFPEADDLAPEIKAVLQRRPAAHLQQHLQTGHFTSVLRFLSDALETHDRFPELRFYACLARCLRRYQAAHPELTERFALFDLFTAKVPRICINRVRLAIGYGDANRRPVPSLGTNLNNPLHLAERSETEQPRSLVGAQP
ncbi:IucA/IucC family protein [Bosea psychrotolerans]|uniref:Siderophore synthetase component n=1 Tax=Bosea psychrotolerans TaxID=1871628 RepID=A0A2S4MKH2_9HYPH|nr:IucA/IucC family protein [Bosea psychrotolerans]POR55246.1 siderophore synthetase component [Bosea psychrotolerans]